MWLQTLESRFWCLFSQDLIRNLWFTPDALDRDVMVADTPELKRLDLQLLAMIADAKSILTSLQIEVEPKFLMTGFSASATFTNRFSFLHPETIKALAIGGLTGN